MTDTEKEQEIWRPYPDYPWVEVSNLGRIRTKDRYVKNGYKSKRLVKGCILKQRSNKYGYITVHFNANGKQICLRVNRAVAICFLPNPNNLPEVNHIDNDKTNNSVFNLEWCTHKYNIDYKEKYGKSAKEVAKEYYSRAGYNIIAVNLDNYEVLKFVSRNEAGRKLNIPYQSIGKVINGKQNRTHGWWFCSADESAVEKTRAKFGDEIAKKVEKLINEN